MSAMKIEEMTAAHVDGVCALENACFVHPWSRQSVESEIDNAQSVFYVAVENGAVIGCGKHDELMEKCTEYKEISDSQMGGAFID